jgi:hypothetical protein
MGTWPANLQIGEGATPNELDIDEPITSSHAKRYRDRDGRLNDTLQDGAAAPFDIDTNNVTVRGTLDVTGVSTLTGNVNAQADLTVSGTLTVGALVIPETALIFAGL